MKRHYVVPIIFMLLLCSVGILYFVVPDAGVSSDENRSLAQLPTFSFASLADGSYTAAIDEYLKDQFPFRGAFISAADKANAVLALSGGEVEMVMGVGNTDMGVGETLGDVPEIAEEPEEEPVEEKPAAAEIQLADEADYNRNGIIISGDRAMELFGSSYGMLEQYASIVNSFKNELPDVNVYSLFVPTSVEFYSPLKYHQNERSQKAAIETLDSLFMNEVIPVDAYTYLAANADKYIYFRTDHHWTARGAYQGYYAFCKAAGLEAVPEENFEVTQAEGSFLGTLYRYTKKQVLHDNPDYVEILNPPEVESCTAYTSADMTYPYEASVIADTSDSTNKYLSFLGGDHPLMRIVTNNKNGRRVLILKDSFGNAFVPFLINHYEEIYVIDPRSASASISEFCAQHEINDLILENYAFAVGNSAILKGLKAMIR